MDIMSRQAMPRLGGMIVTVLMGLAWSLPVHTYAQTIKVRGKSQQARFVARNEVPLGGMVMGRLESLFRVLKSDDPAWNDVQVFSVRFSDPEMRQNGTGRVTWSSSIRMGSAWTARKFSARQSRLTSTTVGRSERMSTASEAPRP
jgi:hypothetical protein